MVHLNLTIDKRRARNDGRFPVVFKISSNGSSRDFATGYHVNTTEWNAKKKLLSRNYPAHEEANTQLQELQAELRAKIIEYERNNKGIVLHAQDIKNYLVDGPREEITVYEFWKFEVELLEKVGRHGGARVYRETLSALHNTMSLQISFEKVDYNFLKLLEAKLMERGAKVNTVSVYLRTLRAVFNKAVNARVAPYGCYPFRSYRIRKASTAPLVISIEELRQLFTLSLEKGSLLYDSWMMAKLMYMLIGINITDLLLLRENNIVDGRVNYKRAKTGKTYSVKLLPEAELILKHFAANDTPTLLGKITRLDLESGAKLRAIIKQKNKTFNKHLAQLGRIIGCKIKLRGYVLRYSWSNAARKLGYSKDLIAQALGHEEGNEVTEIYLQDYGMEEVDVMNERVCRDVVR